MSKSDVERIPCSDKNKEKWHCTRKERSERRANTENRKDVVVKHSCLKRPRTAGERDSSKRNRYSHPKKNWRRTDEEFRKSE